MPVTAAPVAPSTEFRVGLTECDITASTADITGQPTTLVVSNAGATTNDLRGGGRGRGRRRHTAAQHGEQQELVVTAPPGASVQPWCTVPGHRAQGMHALLTVPQSRHRLR